MVTKNMMSTYEGKWVFSEKKNQAALVLNKCLKQIKQQRSLYTKLFLSYHLNTMIGLVQYMYSRNTGNVITCNFNPRTRRIPFDPYHNLDCLLSFKEPEHKQQGITKNK